MAAFRYLVADVSASVTFYTSHLGFKVVEQYGPAMAILSRDDVTLWLAGPASSAARPMPDGGKPQPGGWNRLGLFFPLFCAPCSRTQKMVGEEKKGHFSPAVIPLFAS